MTEKPKVSICMITYGHEKYIREAVESILMQKTNFTIELVLANDCSPDNTDQVIQDIINHHPYSNKIKYIKHPQNIGMMPNLIDAIKNCTGEYIAFCEGDDYWTDPYKLQKQVEFLEINSRYIGVSTGYQNIDESGKIIDTNTELPFNIKIIETKHLIQKNLIATCTVLLKNNFAKTKIDYDFLKDKMLGDLSIWLLSSLKGPIYFIQDVTAAYRNGVGVSTTFSQLKYLEISSQLREDFINKYSPSINIRFSYWKVKSYYLLNQSKRLAENNLKKAAAIKLIKSMLYIPLNLLDSKALQKVRFKNILLNLKLIFISRA